MRQLNLGAPFLDGHRILGHVYCRDPCRGQVSVNTGLCDVNCSYGAR